MPNSIYRVYITEIELANTMERAMKQGRAIAVSRLDQLDYYEVSSYVLLFRMLALNAQKLMSSLNSILLFADYNLDNTESQIELL